MPLSKKTRTRLINRDGKKVREHRWLMEQKLGRKLMRTEHIHHINGNPLDNRLENLELLEQTKHMRLHKERYPHEKICAVCRVTYTPAMRKRKTSQTCSKACAYALRSATRRGVVPQIPELIARRIASFEQACTQEESR